MQPGYYLSVYTCVDPMLYLHEIQVRHDHNMTLWHFENNNLELVKHWEFERISGEKHHAANFRSVNSFHIFVDEILKEFNLNKDDIIGIFGTPKISTHENLYEMPNQLGITYHSLFHLYTAMLMDTDIFSNQTILTLALDGGADILSDSNIKEMYQFAGAVSICGNISVFPAISPGVYWWKSKMMLGLEEGTLMALATASESRCLVSLYGLQSIIMPKFLDDEKQVNTFITELWNKICEFSDTDAGVKFNFYDKRFTEEENKISMYMKIIQGISIYIMEQQIERICSEYKLNTNDIYLSLSGGYALNCPTNTHLMKKYNFKGQLIPPCVNDGGQAIGMGLYFFNMKSPSFSFHLEHAFYGDKNVGKDLGIYANFVEFAEYGLEYIADDICNSPIVYFAGRAEIGPRALGHRSILADPRLKRSRELLNLYKKRQWWRPVAPIILEQFASQWFDDVFPSKYMLHNFQVKPEYHNLIPAVVHLDGSARIQTICQKDDDTLYKIIMDFYEKTGVPMICNTSLNDRGEPIIDNAKQAINFALRKNIKIVYIDGTRYILKNHVEFQKKCHKPEKRILNVSEDFYQDNPYNLSIHEYLFWMHYNEVNNIDIRENNGALMVKRIFKKICKANPSVIYDLLDFSDYTV